MKKLILSTVMICMGLAIAPVYAATATGTFNVAITLTSQCQINATAGAEGAVIDDLTFTYTSFQATAATASSNFNVRCTNGLPYNLALSDSSATDSAVNLAYTLTLSANSGTGNGSNQSFSVNGQIAAGQGGNCDTATCNNTGATNSKKTLTITY